MKKRVKHKTLIFEMSSSSHYFRISDTKTPAEEVSEAAEGIYKGRKFRTLYTVVVKPDGDFAGRGILYAKGSISYRIIGFARGGKDFSEKVRGEMTFGLTDAPHLKQLENVKASFETEVDSRGNSTTKAWKV